MIKPAQAAELLSVAESTIRAMLIDGRLPGLVIRPSKPGGKCIYRVDETRLSELGFQHQQEQLDDGDEVELHLDEI